MIELINYKGIKNIMADNAVIYTPNQIEEAYKNTLNCIFDIEPCLIKGEYLDQGGKLYGVIYFDKIKDPITNKQMSLKVHRNLKPHLRNGMVYIFKGMIERQFSNNDDINIRVAFNPSEIVKGEAKVLDERLEAEARIVRERLNKGTIDVSRRLTEILVSGRKPRLLCVFGETGIVDADFLKGIQDAQECFDLKETKVKLNRETLCYILEKADPIYDVIIFLRGGGQGLEEIFNDQIIARQVVRLQKAAFVACLGHDLNNTLVKAVADLSFPVPYAFGEYLRNIWNTTKITQENVQASIQDTVTKKLESDAVKSQISWKLKLAFLIGTITGLVGMYLIKLLF
jgi:hypothetical protein